MEELEDKQGEPMDGIEKTIDKLRLYFGWASRSYSYWQEGWALLTEKKQVLQASNKFSIIMEAYCVAWKLIRARYLKAPREQLECIQQFLPELTRLAKANPQDIEVFFIRTAIISNLPSLFNLELEASRDTRRLVSFLEENWRDLKPSLREAIVGFLKTSIYIEPPEKRKIQGWLK
jgi:hypothetical protein